MKNYIRKKIRVSLGLMSEEEKANQSAYICDCIIKHKEIKAQKMVALFLSLPDEPYTDTMLSQLSKLCKVVVPKVCGDVMQFYPYLPESMSKGVYGIYEPETGLPVSVADIDVVVVPGVAFTRNGARLGRGKGYYDKYMSQPGFKAYKIGICYNCQVVDELPFEEHDVLINEVIFKK